MHGYKLEFNSMVLKSYVIFATEWLSGFR